MRRNWKQRAMIGVAVVAVIAGVIVAIVTATGHSHAPVNSAGAGSGRGGSRGDLAVAASYLRLTRAQLRRERRSGRSLARIADATSGRSAAGLVEALVSARKASLAAAVGTGSLSRAIENMRLSTLRRRVTAEVDRSPAQWLPARARLGRAGSPSREAGSCADCGRARQDSNR